jgi:hypothetical protein
MVILESVTGDDTHILKRFDLIKGQLDLATFHVEFAYLICRVLLGIG